MARFGDEVLHNVVFDGSAGATPEFQTYSYAEAAVPPQTNYVQPASSYTPTGSYDPRDPSQDPPLLDGESYMRSRDAEIS